MSERPSSLRKSSTVAISLSRRTLLASAATGVFAAFPGCTGLLNAMAGVALREVNLFNQTSNRVSGNIDITGPDDDTVLSETFELVPESKAGDQSDGSATDVYDNAWEDAGTYEVRVELADGVDIQGPLNATESVAVADPDEEMLAVVFGASEGDAGISFTLGESFSEFGLQNSAVAPDSQ